MFVDTKAFSDGMDEMLARVAAATPKLVTEGAALIENEGMRLSPVRSGTLRRSWRVEGPRVMPGAASAHVGPTIIYSRRIELGFHGTDSIGRHYNQDGKPYARPAVERSGPKVINLWKAGLKVAINGG